MTARPEMPRGKPDLGMISLLVVELVIGYEWFMSGLVKIVRGDFPSGLAAVLLEKLPQVLPWYANVMKRNFIPNAESFGYVIEIAEILAGIVLIVGPLIWIFAWDRVSFSVRLTVLGLIAFAAIGGTFLTINLHLANGSTHPWLIPDSSFDEGIDFDSVLPALQIVIAWMSIFHLRHLRKEQTSVRRAEPIKS